jgi:hypothetical protein
MAAKKRAAKKTVRRRVVKFGGRLWVIERVDNETNAPNLQRSNLGEINMVDNVISYRAPNEDTALIVLFHELIHHACPTLPEREVNRADSMLKDSIEAFGVDLSPMLSGYK